MRVSLRWLPRSGISGSQGVPRFNFAKYCLLASQNGCAKSHAHNSAWGLLCPFTVASTWEYGLFFFVTNVKYYLTVLIIVTLSVFPPGLSLRMAGPHRRYIYSLSILLSACHILGVSIYTIEQMENDSLEQPSWAQAWLLGRRTCHEWANSKSCFAKVSESCWPRGNSRGTPRAARGNAREWVFPQSQKRATGLQSLTSVFL